MNPNPSERVLVTGASSGIGRELAKLFAAEGCDLVLVARREERLTELQRELEAAHGIDVRCHSADLSTPAAAPDLCAWLEDEGLRVDVLVNNAGFGLRGEALQLEIEEQREIVRLNVLTLMDLSLRLLPAMVERESGGILNVGSIAGFVPGGLMAVYYGSKAFVNSFSEALHEELRGSGVTITNLAPGPTRSEFQERAGMNKAAVFKVGVQSSEAVARTGHRAFRKGRAVVIPGWLNRLCILLVRFSPRVVVRRMVKKLQ